MDGNGVNRIGGRVISRSFAAAAALVLGALGPSLALADPEPEPAPPAAPAVSAAPVTSASNPLCAVVRGNTTQIGDVIWPLKVATKVEGWEWADDAVAARSRIDGQLPPLLNNVQQGITAHPSGDIADAVRGIVSSGKDLITTIDHNGDGGDTSGALAALDKALDESLRACIDQ